MSIRLNGFSAVRFSRLAWILGLVACLASFAGVLPAQTVHFSSAVERLVGGLSVNAPQGLALDAAGNIFVADGSEVKEVLAASGYTTVQVVCGATFDIRGLAMDASGNLFVTDYSSTVEEFVAVGGYTTVNKLGGGFDFGMPNGVAVDTSGNVFVANWAGETVNEILAAGGYTTVKTLGSGFGHLWGVAVDRSGNVFVSDYGNSAVKEILAAGGYATVKKLGSGFTQPAGLTLDGHGNVFVADGTTVKEIVAAGGYTTVKAICNGFKAPWGVAVGAGGNIYVSDYQAVDKISVANGRFGLANVGTPGVAIGLIFTFDTFAALGSKAVLTQGVKGLDFIPLSTGTTCKAGTAYQSGDICVVRVTFKPKKPGTRYGAVELFDTSGNLLATGYMQGTGVGPLVNFAKTTSGVFLPSAQTTVGSGFDRPYGVALDGAGNAFVSDTYDNAVKEVMAAGGYTTVKTLSSAFAFPTGVAVDGAGNLFVADTDNNAVRELLAVSGYTTVKTLGSGIGLNHPTGVAVDGNENVFVADQNNSAVKEMLAANNYATVYTLASGFDFPTGVAVDGNGNVFVADTYNNAVKEIVAAGGYTTVKTLGSGFNRPTGVTLDASGNILVADEDNNAVKEIVAASGYTTVRTLGSGFNLPGGVATDGNGNVFVADIGNNRALKLTFASPPALYFAATDVSLESSNSPQRVTVSNIGNAALTFPVPASGNNPGISAGFKLDATTTCPNLTTSSAAGTLGNGKSCVYALDFVPAALGTNSGSLTLMDDNLNAAGPSYATQSIALSGKGVQVPFGVLSQAVDNVTSTSTVSQADSLKVVGWVADPVDGAPLINVKVKIDGVSIGTPTLGIARADIAAAYGSAYLNSGYRMLYPASSLALGTHQVTVVAVDAGGRATTFGPLTITVQ